jgi:hypothetical protein
LKDRNADGKISDNETDVKYIWWGEHGNGNELIEY